MKEFRTLRVTPNQETRTLVYMEKHNWHLDSRQEIYNKSERIVGMSTDINLGANYNNAAISGFSGTGKTSVQTKEEVTHFVTLNFSRETDTKNHKRIVELETAQNNFRYTPPQTLKKVPNYILFLIISAFVSLGAFTSNSLDTIEIIIGSAFALISVYLLICLITKKRARIKLENANIAERNRQTKEKETNAYKKITDELDILLAEERAELKNKN